MTKLEEFRVKRYDALDEEDVLDGIIYTTYIFFYVVMNFRTMRAGEGNPWGDDKIRGKVGRNLDRTIANKKEEDENLKVTFYMATRADEYHESPVGDVGQQYVNSLPRDSPFFPLVVKIVTAVPEDNGYNSSDVMES